MYSYDIPRQRLDFDGLHIDDLLFRDLERAYGISY